MRRVHRNNPERRRYRESCTPVTLTLKQPLRTWTAQDHVLADNPRTVEIRGTRMTSQPMGGRRNRETVRGNSARSRRALTTHAPLMPPWSDYKEYGR